MKPQSFIRLHPPALLYGFLFLVLLLSSCDQLTLNTFTNFCLQSCCMLIEDGFAVMFVFNAFWKKESQVENKKDGCGFCMTCCWGRTLKQQTQPERSKDLTQQCYAINGHHCFSNCIWLISETVLHIAMMLWHGAFAPSKKCPATLALLLKLQAWIQAVTIVFFLMSLYS